MNSVILQPIREQPPWLITGGAEKETLDHAFQHYDPMNDCLTAYYSLIAQLSYSEFKTKLEEGDSFTIHALVNVMHPTETQKTISMYLNNGSNQSRSIVNLKDGVQYLTFTGGKFSDATSDFVIEIKNAVNDKPSVTHLQIVAIVITF